MRARSDSRNDNNSKYNKIKGKYFSIVVVLSSVSYYIFLPPTEYFLLRQSIHLISTLVTAIFYC